ncbi:MAG: E3 ubiquitin-protein ligase [Promethearchaeota archaeon]|nr:MAG: E3 ubiquitin-protein ligase [Candidatus Lokiarchaeota archaeon]
MVEIDIKNILNKGPEKLVMTLNNAINSERTKEPFEFTKVLRTFVFDSPIKAEISISSGNTSSKISGQIKWIGERRDGNAGIEIFLEANDSKPLSLGTENIDSASFNSDKRILSLSKVPKICPVCKAVIKPTDTIIRCPACKIEAHKDHFLEYVKIHGKCPNCEKRLSMKGKSK